jgi:hypothetical protein
MSPAQFLSWLFGASDPILTPESHLPSSREKIAFEFLLSRELEECGEDEWEWMEGSTANGLKVNISRRHDWSQGIYDEPISITVWLDSEWHSMDLAETWGAKLAEVLGVEVCMGHHLASPSKERWVLKIEQRFGVAADMPALRVK